MFVCASRVFWPQNCVNVRACFRSLQQKIGNSKSQQTKMIKRNKTKVNQITQRHYPELFAAQKSNADNTSK